MIKRMCLILAQTLNYARTLHILNNTSKITVRCTQVSVTTYFDSTMNEAVIVRFDKDEFLKRQMKTDRALSA